MWSELVDSRITCSYCLLYVTLDSALTVFLRSQLIIVRLLTWWWLVQIFSIGHWNALIKDLRFSFISAVVDMIGWLLTFTEIEMENSTVLHFHTLATSLLHLQGVNLMLLVRDQSSHLFVVLLKSSTLTLLCLDWRTTLANELIYHHSLIRISLPLQLLEKCKRLSRWSLTVLILFKSCQCFSQTLREHLVAGVPICSVIDLGTAPSPSSFDPFMSLQRCILKCFTKQ